MKVNENKVTRLLQHKKYLIINAKKQGKNKLITTIVTDYIIQLLLILQIPISLFYCKKNL